MRKKKNNYSLVSRSLVSALATLDRRWISEQKYQALNQQERQH